MTRKASLGAGGRREPEKAIPGHKPRGGIWRAKRAKTHSLCCYGLWRILSGL